MSGRPISRGQLIVFGLLCGGLIWTLYGLLQPGAMAALAVWAAGVVLLFWLAGQLRRVGHPLVSLILLAGLLTAFQFGMSDLIPGTGWGSLLLGLLAAPGLFLTLLYAVDQPDLMSLQSHSLEAGGDVRGGESAESLVPESSKKVWEQCCEDDLEELETLPQQSRDLFSSGREEQVTESWTRSSGAEGERLEGSVCVVFAAGERQRYIHVPCQPMFSENPHVWCACDDDNCSVECDMIRPFGVRLSLRRRSAAPSTAVVTILVVLSASGVISRAA